MRRALPLFVAAFLAVSACAQRAPAPTPGPSPPPPPAASPPSPAVRPPPVSSPADQAYSAGLAAMGEAGYERALDLFAAAWKEDPGHPGVAADFPEALLRLKNGGDESFRQGRGEEAGRRWSAAMRFLSHPAAKGKPLPFTRADLKAGIDRVSAALMEKALVEYRKGDLDAAIATWRSILSFDPSHAEAARSVQTATTQLENLKKINPPR